MTSQEYEEKLRGLSPAELQKFNEDFGGGQKTIEERGREFVSYSEKNERRICQLLGLKTEAKKLTDAALRSANSADQSAKAARLSMICSVIACIAAVIVPIIRLFVKD